MIALPFPQRAAVPLVLSARFVAPLGPNGYDFSAVPRQKMVNVSAGYLYRVLAYSFALELPESVYLGAQTGDPLQFNIRSTGDGADIFAKPIPVPVYHRDTEILQYFHIPDTASDLEARLFGSISHTVETIGFAQISGTLTLTIQALGDSEWYEKYQLGEI